MSYKTRGRVSSSYKVARDFRLVDTSDKHDILAKNRPTYIFVLHLDDSEDIVHKKVYMRGSDKLLLFSDTTGKKLNMQLSDITKVEDYYVNNIHYYNPAGYNNMPFSNNILDLPSFAFRILNKTITKNGEIRERRESETYKEDLRRWEYAKRFNLKSKMTHQGQLSFVNSKLIYTFEKSIAEANVPKGAEIVTPIPRSYGAYLNSLRYLSNSPIPPHMCEFSNLASVQILGQPKSIGKCAFSSCENLKVMELPSSVQKIGDFAFIGNKNLTTIKFNGLLKYLGRGVFDKCTSLQEVILPNGFEHILEGTFSKCRSLSYLFIPKSVKAVSQDTFFSSYEVNYCSRNKLVLYNPNLKIKAPSHLRSDLNTIFLDHGIHVNITYY